MVKSKGVLYIATGEKYVEEAATSARSLKTHMPNIPITIATDDIYETDVFDTVVELDSPEYSYADNVRYIGLTPYERTLFIDSDTYITGDISEIFDILDEFDIATAHDTGRRREFYRDDEIKVNAPDCFPMYNSGVVVYNDSSAVNELFDKWSDIYERHSSKVPGVVNQPSFREALYVSNVRIATLPPEYNCRLPYPTYLRGDVKIIHGRASNFEPTEQILNKEPTESRRTFLTFAGRNGHYILRLDLDKWQYRQRSLFESLFERGLGETLKGLVRWYQGGDFWES